MLTTSSKYTNLNTLIIIFINSSIYTRLLTTPSKTNYTLSTSTSLFIKNYTTLIHYINIKSKKSKCNIRCIIIVIGITILAILLTLFLFFYKAKKKTKYKLNKLNKLNELNNSRIYINEIYSNIEK